MSGEAIVGAAVNRTGKSVEGPFALSVCCFDGDKMLSQQGAFAEQQGVPPRPTDRSHTAPGSPSRLGTGTDRVRMRERGSML